MNFSSSTHYGVIVQVVTDYTFERIGKITDIQDGQYLKLEPVDNEELNKLVFTAEELKNESNRVASIKWPVVINAKTIKEIIILSK